MLASEVEEARMLVDTAERAKKNADGEVSTSYEKSQDVAHNLQHLDNCGNVIIDKVKALEFEIKEILL